MRRQHVLQIVIPTPLAPDLGDRQLSLSRLNHWLPGRKAYPKVMQGTAEFHHQIAHALFPEADPVFDNATALDTAIDMLNPQPALVQRLVRHVLLQC
jgi:hypothetical protein